MYGPLGSANGSNRSTPPRKFFQQRIIIYSADELETIGAL